MTASFVPAWAQPRSCYSVLRTPPTEKPITVAEAKLRAGLDWSVDDPREALVPQFIAAARSMVERDTGLALLTQSRDIYLWPYDPSLPVPLPVQATPVQQILLMEQWTPTSAAPAAWRAIPVSSTAVPRTVDIPAGAGAHLLVVAGWTDPKALLAEAPLLVQAVGLLTAHMLTLGRDMALVGSAVAVTPYGYDACVAPHRLTWVP